LGSRNVKKKSCDVGPPRGRTGESKGGLHREGQGGEGGEKGKVKGLKPESDARREKKE